MEQLIFKDRVAQIKGNKKITGTLEISSNFLIFRPLHSNEPTENEAIYRIVQTGYRKILQFIPNKFYIKTMSGKVLYFQTTKAKKLAQIIEKIIYFS
jgi:hypothetical protein